MIGGLGTSLLGCTLFDSALCAVEEVAMLVDCSSTTTACVPDHSFAADAMPGDAAWVTAIVDCKPHFDDVTNSWVMSAELTCCCGTCFDWAILSVEELSVRVCLELLSDSIEGDVWADSVLTTSNDITNSDLLGVDSCADGNVTPR